MEVTTPAHLAACNEARNGRKAAECMYMKVVPESMMVEEGVSEGASFEAWG